MEVLEDVTVSRARGARRGEQGWRELFERFAGAGLSITQFCQREEVSRHSFERWRARLRGGAGAVPTVNSPTAAPSSLSPFVDLGELAKPGPSPLGLAAAPALEVRIDLGGGVTLTVTRR